MNIEHWDLSDLYSHTMARLDAKCADLNAQFSQWMACQKGCSGCCRDGFKISYVEALGLLHGLSKLPEGKRDYLYNQLNQPSAESTQCPLLIDGACAVYQQRPALCRAYGLVVKVGDKVATCALNFNDAAPSNLKILDLEPFYNLLDEISNRLWHQFHADEHGPAPHKLSIRNYLLWMLGHRENY